MAARTSLSAPARDEKEPAHKTLLMHQPTPLKPLKKAGLQAGPLGEPKWRPLRRPPQPGDAPVTAVAVPVTVLKQEAASVPPAAVLPSPKPPPGFAAPAPPGDVPSKKTARARKKNTKPKPVLAQALGVEEKSKSQSITKKGPQSDVAAKPPLPKKTSERVPLSSGEGAVVKRRFPVVVLPPEPDPDTGVLFRVQTREETRMILTREKREHELMALYPAVLASDWEAYTSDALAFCRSSENQLEFAGACNVIGVLLNMLAREEYIVPLHVKGEEKNYLLISERAFSALGVIVCYLAGHFHKVPLEMKRLSMYSEGDLGQEEQVSIQPASSE
jgi:hypothetical protein